MEPSLSAFPHPIPSSLAGTKHVTYTDPAISTWFRQPSPTQTRSLRSTRSMANELGPGFKLKPRPHFTRPSPPTPDPATAPDDAKPPTLDLSSQIQKLVFLRRHAEALELFEILRNSATALEASTYDSLVTACIHAGSVQDVKAVHGHMIETGFEFDQYAWNRVLLMYVRRWLMQDARQLFDEMPTRNSVTWNTMISGLLNEGSFAEVLDRFLVVFEEKASGIGTRILAMAMRASAGLGDVAAARLLHSLAVKQGFSTDIYSSCALTDVYSKCGHIIEARRVFDEMPTKTMVGWNAIITGYSLNGYGEEALVLYSQMRESGVRADEYTYSVIFKICACLAFLEHAKQAHASYVRNGFGWDLVANSALLDCYCKWGRMEDARHVFDKMPYKNVISWNTLIAGYGYHGRGEEAVKMFECMVKGGIMPTHVTFLAVLTACRYSGLVREGWDIFGAMQRDYNVWPRAKHYACMVELLGREGLLDEALALIKEAPFSPTRNMWGALLTACRIHKNVRLGKLAAETLLMSDSVKTSNYIVLSNIYSDSGRLDAAKDVLETMERKGMGPSVASSWIDINKQSHQFLFHDISHPLTDEIYRKLDELMGEVEKLGYTFGGSTLLPDVHEHDQKMPRYHSEKLAIAFGVLVTPGSSPLQVVQNHRICNDCHEVIKLFSLVTKRNLVVRDSSRFHHFMDGFCSCGDYW